MCALGRGGQLCYIRSVVNMGLCATTEAPVKHKSGNLTPLVVSTPSYMCGCVVVWVGACVWVFCGCRGVHE